MVSTSKILTVSYGTFSCTLEGFDDSFETMKAIAEYFRDLAAEDRYFGAEPPVPDAEMLARIAEREIARRVEAREERGSIVLRAQPYGTVSAPLVAPPPAPLAPEAETAQEVPQTVAPDFPPAPPIATAATAQTDPDSMAAKLQRIRDVVRHSAAPAAPDPYTEDEHADSFLTETARGIETALAADDLTEDDIGADQDGDQGGDGPDSAAIAALLSRLTGDAPVTPDLQDPLAEAVDEAVSAAQQDGDDPEDDLIEVEIADDMDDDTAAGAPLTARVIKMKRADFEAALASGELVPDDDEDEDEDDIAAEIAAKVIEDAQQVASASQSGLRILPGAGLSPQQEADLRRELAAVEAELGDITRDTEGPADPRRAVTEDEDDLTSLFDPAQDEDDQDRAAEVAPLVLRDPREHLVKTRAEDDMSRLMAKAETAMTEPENANRRNAIAHLRAAVAATKAEQSAGTLPPREPATSAFRDDLANVVRPRRLMAEAEAATPRPAEARPAPLKLVAEQRVDLRGEGDSAPARTPARMPDSTPDSAAPVRPRRVALTTVTEQVPASTAAAIAEAEAEGGFAEFARTMGAMELPDLLEAAAAYLVHVEGRAEFSRPQVMNKARQGSTDPLTREDGLRAFGLLLRQGKILKLAGGRFTAAEDIGFKPAARRAG
jgi:hypothetical protein